MRRLFSVPCVGVRSQAPALAAVASPTTSSSSGGAASSQARGFFCFTCQSPTLIEEQKKRGFKSDFWVGISSALRQRCEIRPGEKPVKATQLPKAVELYNLDDMLCSKEYMFKLGHTNAHSSVTNKKVYQTDFQMHLEDRCQLHGFKSKWWIGRWSAWKEGGEFQPSSNCRLVRITVDWTEPMVNMDQLKKNEAFTSLCYDGGMAEHFSQESNKLIYQTQKNLANEMGSPGVFYSIAQCEKLGLKIDDTKALIVNNLQSSTNISHATPNWIYNWCEFEGWDNPIVQQRKLHRNVQGRDALTSASATPLWGVNGNEVKGDHIMKRIHALPEKHPTNVWIFEYEMKKFGLRLSGGRRPYNVKHRINAIKQMETQANSAEKTSMFLPLEHLEDPVMGKKKFGTLVL